MPPQPPHADYYGDITHFASRSNRKGYYVMPRHGSAPEPNFGGMDRWAWLGSFGRQGSDVARKPHFSALFNGFESGVNSGSYRMACALELLSGLKNHDNGAASARLLAVASIPHADPDKVRPDKEFMCEAWRGLYLLMEHCMDAAGTSWSDVLPESFPSLTLRDDPSSGTLLSTWPAGYADWVPAIDRLPEESVLQLSVGADCDFGWIQAARIWASVRRGNPQPDWLANVASWTPESGAASPVLTGRPKDGLLGRRPQTIGRFDDAGSMRHASPLALLMAGMAADAHISKNTDLFRELGRRMNEPIEQPVPHPLPDYESVWINTATKMRAVLRAATPRTAGRPTSPPGEVSRFTATPSFQVTTFDEGPLLASSTSWDAQDNELVHVALPISAFGSDADECLRRWSSRGVPCFVEVNRRLSDRSEPHCFASATDSWQEGDCLHLLLRPRVQSDSWLYSVWSGAVESSKVSMRCWLVDGAERGSPAFPVLYLRFELRIV